MCSVFSAKYVTQTCLFAGPLYDDAWPLRCTLAIYLRIKSERALFAVPNNNSNEYACRPVDDVTGTGGLNRIIYSPARKCGGCGAANKQCNCLSVSSSSSSPASPSTNNAAN